MIKIFLFALQFLTIIPIKLSSKIEDTAIGRSTIFFPLVGAIQGTILIGTNILFSKLLPTDVVSGVILVILILTNGGFHLDGFADTIDGIAGGNTKEKQLEIMRDSQIGAIGVVAIAAILLLKFLALNNLPLDTKNYILFLTPVIGRWAIVPMAYWANYAREGNGLGKAFTKHTGIKEFLIATIFVLLFSSIFWSWQILPCLIILLFSTYLISAFFKKRLGGVTGDIFGFQSEVTEVLFLLLVLINFKLSGV